MLNISSSLKLLIIILAPLFVLSCSTPKMQEPKTEIDIDIPVVYNPENPEPPPGMPSKITLKEELCLKYEKGKTSQFPSEMGFAAVDDEGNIFVTDHTDHKKYAVKVFNKDGKFVRTLKMKRLFSTLRIVEGKGIMIYDYRRNQICYYSAEGQCLEEIGPGKYKDMNLGGPKPDSRGNIIAIFRYHKSRAGWINPERTYIQDLVKIDPNFNSALVISFSSLEWTQTARLDRPMIYPSFTYEVRKDDSIVWGKTNPEYEFFITNSQGKTIKKIVKEHSPRRITEEDKKEMINYWYRGKAPEGRLLFDEYFPSFRIIRCDDEGKIYIKTYEKDKNDRVFWDVFDREGRYISKFSLSKNETIFDIKENHIYSHSDLIELPFVKRYRVNWE